MAGLRTSPISSSSMLVTSRITGAPPSGCGCGVGALFSDMPALLILKSARLKVPDCESMNESLLLSLHRRDSSRGEVARSRAQARAKRT